MRLRELTLADAASVAGRMRNLDRQCVRALLGDITDDEFAADRFRAFAAGAGWSLVDDAGTPWAISGLSFSNTWTCVLWLVVVDGLPLQSWRKLVGAAKTLVAKAIEPSSPLGTHRIEAHVLSTWTEAQHLVRRVGMQLEGVRRCAGRGGEDIQVWAAVRRPQGD